MSQTRAEPVCRWAASRRSSAARLGTPSSRRRASRQRHQDPRDTA